VGIARRRTFIEPKSSKWHGPIQRKLAMANFGQSGIIRGRPVLRVYWRLGPLALFRLADAGIERDVGGRFVEPTHSNRCSPTRIEVRRRQLLGRLLVSRLVLPKAS
jgi:hypothetical protein